MKLNYFWLGLYCWSSHTSPNLKFYFLIIYLLGSDLCGPGKGLGHANLEVETWKAPCEAGFTKLVKTSRFQWWKDYKLPHSLLAMGPTASEPSFIVRFLCNK